jgi:hypothetical protein
MFHLSNYVLKNRAQKARPADFGLDIAHVYSVGVFKPFRGQGVARFMYEALDHILMAGLPTSRDHLQHFTSIHIGCSAPETMHLCEKFGYNKISEVVYSQEMDLILSHGALEVAMPGHGNKEVADKFRGTEPRLEYWVKLAHGL